jgi:hypothetical protein
MIPARPQSLSGARRDYPGRAAFALGPYRGQGVPHRVPQLRASSRPQAWPSRQRSVP